MSIGSRKLKALGEFKPFGLVAEGLDGKQPSPGGDSVVPEKYDYFLFHPGVVRPKDDRPATDFEFASPSPSLDGGDHEIFVRGNRIIWSAGTRLHKRYTSPSAVIMVCWCRMQSISDAFLCVLQFDTLSLYSASGEVVCIPLPFAIASISALPCGLLLHKSADVNRRKSSSGSLLNARDMSRPSKEYGSFHHASSQTNPFESGIKENGATMSSHLILKHPLEDPQATYIEERGKLTVMRNYEEKTLWSSDAVPLMASYHKGKLQHSLWFIGNADSSKSMKAANVHDISTELYNQQFLFQRIWQGKCSQSSANKVFLATDIDGVPIICFLLIEKKVLLAVRLQMDEGSGEVIVDIKPHMSWTIPAIAAAPVIVTRPRVKFGLLPFTDIIVLGAENRLLLYSGNHCLCSYLFPSNVGRGIVLGNVHSVGAPDMPTDINIIGVENAVQDRINVITSSGKIFRCMLGRNPTSSLANDCITAMAEGLDISLYNYFTILLWGCSEPSTLDHAELEWESFTHAIMKLCNGYKSVSPNYSIAVPATAWDFLIRSDYHDFYLTKYSECGISQKLLDSRGSKSKSSGILYGKNHDVSSHAQLLMETLDSMHALYESLKLDSLRKKDVETLVTLLCTIATSLGEASYVDYYIRDFPFLAENCSLVPTVATRSPPSLFQWLEECLQKGCHLSNNKNIPNLVCKERVQSVIWARKIVSFFSLMLGAERKGRKLSSGVYCEISNGSARTPEELTVLCMVGERFGRQQMDLLPLGVSLPLRHVLDKCRESPPSDWPATAYVLVGREDLAMACFGSLAKEGLSPNSLNLVAISVPYTLHMQSVSVPSTDSEDTSLDIKNLEESESVYRSLEDGMEHIFNSSTQLRFGRDLRLNEVRRLLCSARPVAIQMPINPSASDQDLQQHQLWNLAQRTTALPFGRGAFTIATTVTLLTEELVVPKLVLAGRLPAQQNATVNLDPNIRSITELRSWPEFHNGVAAGLRLAPFEGIVSRTWIQYNKPEEPNYTHAGILLALGLHGHLRVLIMADIYKYLSQEHDITTVGLLLGVAASYRGTMNPEVSKMLYLHIPSRHPSMLEVELPSILQSAALVAIGVLYEGSGHSLTMNILLGEIGRRSGGDNVLEREGYAVAAGYALGLVALGCGIDAFGFMDHFVDRLLQYIGEKGINNDKSPFVVQKADDPFRNMGQTDGTQINVDVTAPGATIALALIFMKTDSEVIASRLRLPVTYFDLQYVRPDFIMLRVIARSLIMWSSTQPCREWVDSQIPEIIKIGIIRLGDEAIDDNKHDAEAIIQAYVNIVTGACISIGLKYAGTRSGDAQQLLYSYAIYFLNEIKHIPAKTDSTLPGGLQLYVDRGTLEICLHLIVLSLSVVMAGSGHLQTFRLLRYLRSRNSAEGNINYGIQMAVSLSNGFLFLGSGMQSFSTGNSSIAALLMTLYPRLPTGASDNRCHLQALRHLYVNAVESRWVQTLDVDTGLPVYCPLEVTIKETEHYSETTFCEVTPCILPGRSMLKSVQVRGPRYWPQIIDLTPEDKPWWKYGDKTNPFNGGILYIKRKVGSCSYIDDPVGCQSLFSRAVHKNSFASSGNTDEHDSCKIAHLVSTFSADPSLIAFAQLCCDTSWKSRYDVDFKEFCSQLLFECVSRDRPAILQVYLSFYLIIGSMWVQVKNGQMNFQDSLFLSSLKLALAYNDALISGKLANTRGGIIQSTFLESLRKHIDEILIFPEGWNEMFRDYLNSGRWPDYEKITGRMQANFLSWFLLWYGIPPSHVVKSVVQKIKAKVPMSSSRVPLLQLLMPTTLAKGVIEIDKIDFL